MKDERTFAGLIQGIQAAHRELAAQATTLVDLLHSDTAYPAESRLRSWRTNGCPARDPKRYEMN